MCETETTPVKNGQEEAQTHDRTHDAVRGNWVDLYAPNWAKPYLRLSRADRPVGTWLLLLPCWWGALLGAAQHGGSVGHLLWVMVACAGGAWLMRGAGCVWNDITDREIDAKVERTKSRPLPSGQTTVMRAYIWMFAQAGIAFFILLTLGFHAIVLGAASLVLVAIYPFAKRFTWWPQAFLGLAFNWGAIVAYVAVAQTITVTTLFLYFAGIAWTLFYDTIYAHQDKDDDALIGVKSTARLFAQDTPVWLMRFARISLLFMLGAIFEAYWGRGLVSFSVALVGVMAFLIHLKWQMARVDMDDEESCMHIFRANRDAGLLPALFFAVALMV